MNARFAVIVPTYTEWQYVFRCLRTLVKHTTDYQCYVLDDGSPDWEPGIETEIRRIVPAERLHFERFAENLGLTAAWNRGLELARKNGHTYAALVNSDTLFSPGWLSRTVSALTKADLVGPLSNAPGLSPHQNIRKYRRFYRVDDSDETLTDLASALNSIQPGQLSRGAINGFWMAAKTDVWWANSFDSSHVFNPANRLIDNETEFQKRFKGSVGAMLDVFIFHYRSVSRGLENVNPEFSKGHFRAHGQSSDQRDGATDSTTALAEILPPGITKLLRVRYEYSEPGAALNALHPTKSVGIESDRDLASVAPEFHETVSSPSAEGLPNELATQTGTFDALLFSHVLEHVREPYAVLTEFSQLLRQGGYVAISLPNVGHATVIWNLLWKGNWPTPREFTNGQPHLQWFTKRNITEMLEFANLRPIRWREFFQISEQTPAWKDRWKPRLARGPFRRLLTRRYFVLAQKV